MCPGCNCSPAKPGWCPAHYPLPETLALQSSLIASNDGPWHFDIQPLQVQAVGAPLKGNRRGSCSRQNCCLQGYLFQVFSLPAQFAKQQIGWTFRSACCKQKGWSLFNCMAPLPSHLKDKCVTRFLCLLGIETLGEAHTLSFPSLLPLRDLLRSLGMRVMLLVVGFPLLASAKDKEQIQKRI